MNTDMNIKKIAAACCSGLAVLLMLILPDVRALIVDVAPVRSFAGYELISLGNGAIWFPLLYGIGMTVCALLLDGKISAGICGFGIFVPLLSLILMKDQVIRYISPSFGAPVMPSYTKMPGVVSIGEGFVLATILALAAAVLCLLAGLKRKARHTTAGLTSGDEDEW